MRQIKLLVVVGSVLTLGFGGPVLAREASLDTARAVVEESCQLCHNDVTLLGNMSLDAFDVAAPEDLPELAEKVIRKLRAGMMPPPGVPRPPEEHLEALVTALEDRLDELAAARPNPGRRSFQRLNRAEYEAAIGDLLALEIDAGDYLPLDTKSANFDNIADAQLLSATLMESYLRAAAEVTRLAVGDPNASAREATYRVTRWESQLERVEGAPWGTRGGISVVHNFPADGDYRFRVSFHHETTGALHGSAPAALHTAEGNVEQVEVSINGEPKAVLDIDRWLHVSDPDGVNLRTEPIFVPSGPQRVTAAFIKKFEGPVQDVIRPHDWSIASTSVADAYGVTSLPHLRDLAITGPFDPTGVSDSPSRREIFSCRPSEAADARSCAESIVTRLGAKAYRRPLEAREVEAVMELYDVGEEEAGFEAGVRTALEGVLASPHFVFRFEEPPEGAEPGNEYRITDVDLASRLSFFLWASVPDEELIGLAREGKLSERAVLEAQVRQMLSDPRAAETLATRFARQWLRLPDLTAMHPDVRFYPNFHEQLKQSMWRETELFFENLVREDRSVLELLEADYTFVDERLAEHYGLPDVYGDYFRRVSYPDDSRRGILGHGSVLTLTSQANRTSPVLRGKWVMEVFLGSPPPPPPPDIPELEEAGEAEEGRLLSVREQLERHRDNPTCNACHRMMDPIGLALEHFDATGAHRIRDKDVPIDASGELYDGTPLTSAADLRRALLSRPSPLLRTFTENLMAYALGRRVEHYDMPAVRAIEREVAASGNRVSAFVVGIVTSDAFLMKAAPASDSTVSSGSQ